MCDAGFRKDPYWIEGVLREAVFVVKLPSDNGGGDDKDQTGIITGKLNMNRAHGRGWVQDKRRVSIIFEISYIN